MLELNGYDFVPTPTVLEVTLAGEGAPPKGTYRELRLD